ncbi:MAG: hypothetical protein CMJ90_11005 [Planctomycetes bacterium]|nr:hypothetical protein [Planctomycetota bacterium]
MRSYHLTRLPLFLLLVAGTTVIRVQGQEVGLVESFALAQDRAKAIEQLVPGTEDYYYYRCLERQHAKAFDEVNSLLATWIKRHGRSQRVREVENRQALLTYETDRAATFKFLRDRLKLRFDHQQVVPGSKPDVPTRLDPAAISLATLTKRAFKNHPKSLSGFRTSGLDALASTSLDDRLLTSLLSRLQRPDIPNLPALVVRELENKNSRGFGALGIHDKLLLAQLEECARIRPSLLANTKFVTTWLKRLAPSADVPWRRDAEARESYLERLANFCDRLPAVHNSLKAHVLHHRLQHDLEVSRPDKQRFLSYLRLPRRTGYVNPRYVKDRRGNELVDSSRKYPTGLDSIQNDEALIRAYLGHYFVSEDTIEPYSEFVDRKYLTRIFAETKIISGDPDTERWYSTLDDPAYYDQIRERVELTFPPSQPRFFGTDDAVTIDVDIKNVEKLIVKIYQINTVNYYAEAKREVDATVQVEGLVPSHESTHTYSESPFRRVRRTFSLDELSRPGVYVVDFIGNGIASRAVIVKGRLRYQHRVGAAGHVFRVLDESGEHLKDASIVLGAREFHADDAGEVLIPYSTQPGSKKIVLKRGAVATLESFQHQAERYALRAGIYIDRESLLAGKTAPVIIRPTLVLNGRTVSLELLEDPKLTLKYINQDGIVSVVEVGDLELQSDREAVQEIRVPDDLAQFTAQLRGRVKSLTAGKPVDVSSKLAIFKVNRIEETALTSCPLLVRTPDGHAIDIRGKNGEPNADHALQLTLRHRDFSDSVTVTLKSDQDGRIHLGALQDITSISVSGLPNWCRTWELTSVDRTYPSRIHAPANVKIRVPYQGRAASASRQAVSLLEVRGGAFVRDRLDGVTIAGGFIEIKGLEAGDYDLWLKEANHHIKLKIAGGEVRDGWILGADRMLEMSGTRALHVTDVRRDGDDLVVQCHNTNSSTRVHVFGTRYVAPSALQRLHAHRPPTAGDIAHLHVPSTYASGRKIDDEYRYILDRRYAQKFPGNMLQRPGLLLNPWARKEANDAIDLSGGGGGAFGKRRGGGRGRRALGGGAAASATSAPSAFPNLDFLPEPSRVIANLRPDASGVVRVPIADLGPGHLVHVVAVDGTDTVYTSQALPEKKLAPADRRLARSLNAEKPYAERRSIDFVEAKTPVVIDTRTSDIKTYESLSDVFDLYRTLGGGSDLSTFSFILRWPDLEDERKRELYSQHACHELNFFLHQKDAEFFKDVVGPYLANKAHKTFLDRWLLEEDLTSYLAPRAFSRLNVVERILLTGRTAGVAASGARHIRELLEMVPPNREQDVSRFATAFFSAPPPPSAGKPATLGGLWSDAIGAGGGAGGRAVRNVRPPRSKASKLQAEGNLGHADKKVERPLEELESEEKLLGEDEPVIVDSEVTDRVQRQAQSDLRKRKDNNYAYYRAPERTQSYVEHNYWHRSADNAGPDMIPVNPFWVDYAERPKGRPFFSTHFPDASSCVAEMMLALSVLDLPFKPGEPTIERNGDSITLEGSTPLLLVRKEIKEAAPSTGEANILVSEGFFRMDDRHHFDGREKRDKYVTDEFVAGVSYGCRVVLTNPTAVTQKLDALLQIPEGALAVQRGFETKGVEVRVGAYSTENMEYGFYFPTPGTYAHYPVHTAQDGKLVAAARPTTMNVVATPTSVDTASWGHVSQRGTNEQVMAYLDSANLQRTDLTKIAWRVRDRGLFSQVIDRLRSRHTYNHVLWSYGILHADADAAREYLAQADGFIQGCGPWLDTPLVRVDPVERLAWQQVEYYPLFNARTHRFGRRHQIPNVELARQYDALLHILSSRPTLDDDDWMAVTCYLLLQDRIAESLEAFARVNPERLETRLQHDYMRAYLDFFTDDHAIARDIARRHRDHPVARWRTLFRDIIHQLDEAEGKGVADTDLADRERRQAELAAKAATLDLSVESRKVSIDYKNAERCELSFYEMDIEFLFSSSPFVQKNSGAFAHVRPNRKMTVELPANRTNVTVDLPEAYANANVLVEARTEGIVKRQAYYANSLNVSVMENWGHLKVAHAESSRPMPKVYVKVFARDNGGTVRFHKDGYTDLRGRFDFASLSGPNANTARRYSILILSDDDGAIIREVDAPVQ